MMNRNFLSMKNKVGNNVQDTSSNFLVLVGNWLNDRYFQVKRRANHFSMSRLDYAISATSGTEDYVLPDDFSECISLMDKTNKLRLSQIDMQEWVDNYKNSIDVASNVVSYLIYEDVVQNQPSSASTIAFVSSSSSDTTQTIYVRGEVSGVEDYESVTLSGTAPVATTKSYTKIYAISKSASTVGMITGTYGAGSTVACILSREMIQSRYKKLRLIPPPANNLSLEMIYIPKNLPMINDYDYPILECEDVLEAGATADSLRYKRQYAKADYWENLFESRLDDLMWERENKADMVHTFKPIPYSRDI